MEQAESLVADHVVTILLSRHQWMNEPACSHTTGCKQPTGSVHQLLLPVSTPHMLRQPEAYVRCQYQWEKGQLQRRPIAVNKLAVYGAPSEWIQAMVALVKEPG